jgi:hypothetical protein
MLKRLSVTCFGKPMFVFLVDYGSHVVLGSVWFVVAVCLLLSLVVLFALYGNEIKETGCPDLCVTSLQVREVIFVEEAGFTKPVSDSLQVRECTQEGERSWKEPYSYHRAQRFLVRSVAEAQGKGG